MAEHFLKSIAYGRSGDKGSSCNIGIIAFTQNGYEFLKNELTAKKVHSYFSKFPVTKTNRFEIPNLLAFNFILEGILDGGGSRSLRIDSQGKALGQALLEIKLEIPDELVEESLKFVK